MYIRNTTAILLSLLISILLTGCVAAAAGAAAGQQTSVPSAEEKLYVRMNDLEPRVARAIEGDYLVYGMSPDDVRMVMGEPGEIDEKSDHTLWIYEPGKLRADRLRFEDGILVDAPSIKSER